MSFDPHKSFALLVGVDLYSETDPEENLQGSINDVDKVSSFLRQTLKIPSTNITELKGMGQKVDLTANDAPTGKNLIQKLKDLEGKPAGFVFFYYSGHGDWNDVKDKSDPRDKYEVLCTWEDEVKDTEFGIRLDALAQRHMVLAVLDCCFSGGTDRASFDDPKLKPRWLSLFNKERFRKRSQQSNLGVNNTSAALSIHRDRQYNLITASQPSETAYQDEIGGVPCGIFTHYFLESLEELKSDLRLATYALLQQSVDAKVRRSLERRQKYRQEPLLYGPRDRVVFTADSKTLDTPALLANVFEARPRVVKLDRGLTNGIQQWDKFLIYPPGSVTFGVVAANTNSLTEIQIEKAYNLECVGISTSIPPVPLSSIEIGSFARLSERANATTINIVIPDDKTDPDLERIRKDTPDLITQHIPMIFSFGTPSATDKFDLLVKIDSDMKFNLTTHDGKLIPNLPSILANGPNNAKQLMGLLKHWCLFQQAAKVQPDNTGTTPFTFTFTKTQNPSKSTSSPWQLHFKNTHTAPLHITILNLSPAYGVHVVFPPQDGSSKEVQAGQEEPAIVLYPSVPELLQSKMNQQPVPYVMKDIIKLFVTTRRANYNHYILPNMVSDPTRLEEDASRGKRKPQQSIKIADCLIQEMEIEMTI